jgi:hypothetical protein
MKTPDEIKKGLECCSKPPHEGPCQECPYAPNNGYCAEIKSSDALALIQQLEEQNAELLKKVEQLQAERDSAVSELVGTCQVCRWEETAKCASCHFCEDAWNAHESNWEWRGVQKEE